MPESAGSASVESILDVVRNKNTKGQSDGTKARITKCSSGLYSCMELTVTTPFMSLD